MQVMHMTTISLEIFLDHSSLSHFPYLSGWMYKEQMYLWFSQPCSLSWNTPFTICLQSMTLSSPSV